MPKFNLMSYIMPPEDKMFFTLFQNSAELCIETARLYAHIIESGLTTERANSKSQEKGFYIIKANFKTAE